jgi:chemotaxis protein methyltransferase CheR
MSLSARASHVERFRRAVAAILGLQFDDTRCAFLNEVLERRIAATRKRPDVYLSGLEAGGAKADVIALAEELTVSETSFFRTPAQFRALVETALPARLRSRAEGAPVRILSAGCASGEEAYSLAIALKDAGFDRASEVSILGVDVNPAVLHRAAQGRFTVWALRETPREVQQRWFRREGRGFVLNEAVRAMVRFEPRNLAQPDPQLWQPDAYDVVFFRNVLMYFTHAQARALLARLARSLKAGGYLFLGYAESLRGVSDEFHLRHTHDTFYYQRKECLALSPTVSTSMPRRRHALAVAPDGRAGWHDDVRRAADRVAALASPRLPSPTAPAAARPVWDLGRAFALVHEERFTEALETLEGLPVESDGDPEVLLLRAALLAHRGRLDEAETWCRRLLEIDQLSAGAHHLLALCREGAGDHTSAMHHDRIAVHLDPGFAMPRLHLGLLARRAGDDESARRELQQASALLPAEDGARVLLFGGGFSRDSLVGICRAELAGCGGRP